MLLMSCGAIKAKVLNGTFEILGFCLFIHFCAFICSLLFILTSPVQL